MAILYRRKIKRTHCRRSIY